jgi:methylenetetrahydrofolate--tRNA-(uracil-5-)-methyltransferase
VFVTTTKRDNMKSLHIIGGGLAGCEAAWQAAQRGCSVTLFDMKPKKFSPAHESALLGELVCSNSFRSDDTTSAVGLLKEEMTMLDSLIIQAARATAVPAGKALAVDREKFAAKLTDSIKNHANIEIVREEILNLPETESAPVILATGPLTSEAMAESLCNLTGRERLAFYDAIAPIVEKDSLNMDIVYQKSRYDDGPGDYLNCPMDKEQYQLFIDELRNGGCVPLKDFENAKYFEGCLPVEVMCSRGDDTLRFGPMKPVGLVDPRTGKESYGVVQLRKENTEGSHYNMVGFQTKLTYGEQKRIFRLIPGMENAHFSRLGSIHRNTFICAPELLLPTLQLQSRPNLRIAGQLSGVEGYIESAAMGLLAGINGARLINQQQPLSPPAATALGALCRHLTNKTPKHFQPSNVNFGLFPPLGKKVPKRFRGKIREELSLGLLKQWIEEENVVQ